MSSTAAPTAAEVLAADAFTIVQARKVRRGQSVMLGEMVCPVVYDRTDVNTVLKVRIGEHRRTLTLDPAELVVIARM